MKAVQLLQIEESSVTFPALVALCDDGTIHSMVFRNGLLMSDLKWVKLASPTAEEMGSAGLHPPTAPGTPLTLQNAMESYKCSVCGHSEFQAK